MRTTTQLMLAALIAMPFPARSNPHIAAALETGALSVETALLYELYGALNIENVPEEFREENAPPRGCGTPLIVNALGTEAKSSDEFRRLLAKALARPSLSHQVVSPSGRFRIHYETEGRNSVDPSDEDGNSIPDYIDVVATVIDSMWHLQIEMLGYNPPPTDDGLGGGNEYDIYVEQLGGGYYGFTHPDSDGPTTPTYIRIDNNFTESTYGRLSTCADTRSTRELTALRVSLAHEFFHMVQFGYYQGREGLWWQESSATWMEEVAYPEADDYLQYLCDFLLTNNRSLDSGSLSDRRIYGSSIFSHFLDQRYGRDTVRKVWEEHGRRANSLMENFDRILRRITPGGLDEAINEFGVWNYFTGLRYRDGFYEDGDKYPTIPVETVNLVGDVAVKDSGRVDHLASAYVVFRPQLRTGGVTIATELERSRWRRRLALVSADGVEVKELDNSTPIKLLDWDLYDEVILVISNTDIVGIGYTYSVSAHYKTDMTDQPLPLTFSLGQNFPNPFRPGDHIETRIPYELRTASFATKLVIFTPDGELVRTFDLQQRSPRTYTVVWDGRNEAGRLVNSGLYYYVLKANGNERSGTLAVVRN